MDEYLIRQRSVMRQLVCDYKQERLDLNALIQRLEGVSDVIGLESWKSAVFPIILAMEQVNAAMLEERRSYTSADKAVVESSLNELERLLQLWQV